MDVVIKALSSLRIVNVNMLLLSLLNKAVSCYVDFIYDLRTKNSSLLLLPTGEPISKCDKVEEVRQFTSQVH